MKPERVQIELIRVPGWQLEPGRGPEDWAITRTYQFTDFLNAVDFVCSVASISLEHRHYPEVEINGGEVFLRLATPGVGLTTPDFDLAEMYDRVA